MTSACEAVLAEGEQIEAVGVFEIQNDYKAMALGGLAAGGLMGNSPGASGLAGGAAVEGIRHAEAEREGASVTMGVAVTNRLIHVFAMNELGTSVGDELMRFDRESAEVEVKKLGLTRQIKLRDPESGRELGLTGTALGVGAKGDKAVLALLTHK